MSYECQQACWALSIPSQAKLVLLCLADHADPDWNCWPSVARISKRTGIGPRQIQVWLTWLIENGYLKRQIRPGHANLFHLTPVASNTPERSLTPAATRRGAVVPLRPATPTPVAHNTPTPAAGNTQNLSFELPKNHARAREEENPTSKPAPKADRVGELRKLLHIPDPASAPDWRTDPVLMAAQGQRYHLYRRDHESDEHFAARIQTAIDLQTGRQQA